MAIYRREKTDLYSYDFWLNGERHSGSTGTADEAEAKRFEQMVRGTVPATSAFCRTIIKKAKLRVDQSRRSARGYIYMLRSGYLIKIGHSLDPAERIKALATAMPHGCDLLFCFPGNQQIERALHAEFAACHYSKEWFFLCGKLKEFISEFENPSREVGISVPTEIPVNRTLEIIAA